MSVEFKRAKKEEVQKIHLSLNGEFDMSLREFFSNFIEIFILLKKCIEYFKNIRLLLRVYKMYTK
jgi:hypothetical protein